MKDLTITLNVLISENDTNGSSTDVFEDGFYLALPPAVALDPFTEDYAVAVAKKLMLRALAQAKKEYQPELEGSE